MTQHGGGRPHIQIQLLSDPTYLSGARELVSSVAKRLGFSDMDCSKIALAVDEALCNVIRHGYDRATDRPIWISLWPLAAVEGGDTAGLKLTIEDEAKQIDPSAMKGRELDDIKPGGLGVHIIREVMDQVVFEPREQAGMRLIMIKRAPKPTEAGHLADTDATGGACDATPRQGDA